MDLKRATSVCQFVITVMGGVITAIQMTNWIKWKGEQLKTKPVQKIGFDVQG